MASWYDQGIGDIGRAFGNMSQVLDPNQATTFMATDPRSGANTSSVDQRALVNSPSFDPRTNVGGTMGNDSFWRGIEDPMGRFEQQAARELGQMNTGTGQTGSLSGDASVLNQYDSAFRQASQLTGLDPNLIKAIAATEQGWGAGNVSGAGALGIMQVVPDNGTGNGYAALERQYPNWQTDPTQNILLGAAILKSKIAENGGNVDAGVRGYLGGALDPFTGVTSDQYLSSVKTYQNQLQQSGGMFQGSGTTQPINGQWGGNAVGHGIVGLAEQYLGTPYVWGSIPEPGGTPQSWDCSGFTWWLNHTYGDGTLPNGGHYQYQQAQQQGKLFMDMNQLQPGDLMFFDTGNTAGGGADLNRAGHVAMYIGNGQIIHAANPTDGTIISPLSDYYTTRFIGAEHLSWSGGASGGAMGAYPGQQHAQQGVGYEWWRQTPETLFGAR